MTPCHSRPSDRRCSLRPAAIALAGATLALSGTLAIEVRAQSAPDPVSPERLEGVTVNASADASAGGLKPAYAGGQVARGGRVGLFGNLDIMDTPFSTTNYTQALIQNQQAASVGDVLQNDPAVRVARGFGNFQQLYLVRGLPVYSDDMAYNGLYGLLPRQYLAAEILERVEVLRGASAFLNGAAPGGSGIGGAINVMPKRAPNESLSELTLGGETGGQGYGAIDVARRFGASGELGLRLSGARRDGDTAVDHARRTLSVLSLGADWRSGNVRVSADIGYQNHVLKAAQPSITIATGLAIPDAPDVSHNNAQPWTFSAERDTFGTVRAEVDVTERLTLWVAAGARQGHESAIFANPTVVAANGDTSTYRFDNTRKDDVATGEVGARFALDTGPVRHRFVVSAATYEAKSKNAYAFSNFGGFASNLYAPVDVAPPPADFFSGGVLDAPKLTARTRTSSVAIADVLSTLDDTLLVTLGARRQKIESTSYDYGSGAETASYAARRVTPVAGIVYKPVRMVSLYLTYIEGLVQGDTAPATVGSAPVVNAGEVFKPYQSKQTEAGVKLDTGDFGGTLSVYGTRKPVASFDAASGRFGVGDHQTYRGAELSVFGVVTPRLKVLGGVSVLHTDLAGKDGIGAPKSQGNVGVEWSLPWIEGLSLDGRFVATASQYADADNLQRLPSWRRWDFGARYGVPIGERLLILRARIDNAFDKNYWASAGGYPGAGYLTLASPRTFVMSGSIDF